MILSILYSALKKTSELAISAFGVRLSRSRDVRTIIRLEARGELKGWVIAVLISFEKKSERSNHLNEP